MADFLDSKKPATRALLVGVQTPDMAPGEGAELLAELNELVENLNLGITRSTLINLRDRLQPKFLIGSGKAAELIAQAKADGADVIVLDEVSSPARQRNWEEESGLAVIDRQEVILEIFADRAHTREAVLQVALARMEYSLPRLTRAWSHLSRQRGSGRLGGEGETQLEQDRRLVRNRITHLKGELAQVISQRATQRRQRQRTPVPTRKRALPDGRTLLSPATVGFTRRLPHRLVEAFKATLEEVVVADFLIHLLDASNPNSDQHHATTLAVLGELGAADRPTITVFNKIDAIDAKTLARLRAQHPAALFISVHTGTGLDKLLRRCEELAVDDHESAELLIPHDRYDVVGRLHSIGQVRKQESVDTGVRLSGRFPVKFSALYRPFLLPAPKNKPAARRPRSVLK